MPGWYCCCFAALRVGMFGAIRNMCFWASLSGRVVLHPVVTGPPLGLGGFLGTMLASRAGGAVGRARPGEHSALRSLLWPLLLQRPDRGGPPR